VTEPTVLQVIGKRLGMVLLAAVIAVVIWILFLEMFQINNLIGRRPWDVWAYLFTSDEAELNRDTVFGNLSVTVRDAGIGYLVGICSAFVLAMVFTLSSTLERIFMPTTMLLRSVPLIVLTPLITLLFGIGIGGVTAIVTIVVILPALANILFGLRNSSAQHRDLVAAYGGGRLTALTKVAIPGSLPALMASARISVPSAVTGAMIAEWLATGEGLGGSIARASGSFGFDEMWASAVVITGTTMLVYAVVSILDTIVVARFGALSD
jgi:ABC-type nitrate/sulfonate/bicarbonate transport system permease component